MSRSGVMVLLAAWLALNARMAPAQDAQEITATVSLWGDRTELVADMDSQAGLKLARIAARPADASPADWFAQNRATLQAGGKNFCHIQSGTNWLAPQSAEVSLGAEDRIELRVEYPPVTERPLRFDFASLKTLAGREGYGVALTVLDRVNQKVLAQRVVFADAPTLLEEIADFAPVTDAVSITKPALAEKVVTSNLALAWSEPPVKAPSARRAWPFLAVAGLLLLAVLAWRGARKNFK